MKTHILAILVIGLTCFFIGLFTAAILIQDEVHKAVFEAFNSYYATYGGI